MTAIEVMRLVVATMIGFWVGVVAGRFYGLYLARTDKGSVEK